MILSTRTLTRTEAAELGCLKKNNGNEMILAGLRCGRNQKLSAPKTGGRDGLYVRCSKAAFVITENSNENTSGSSRQSTREITPLEMTVDIKRGKRTIQHLVPLATSLCNCLGCAGARKSGQSNGHNNQPTGANATLMRSQGDDFPTTCRH